MDRVKKANGEVLIAKASEALHVENRVVLENHVINGGSAIIDGASIHIEEGKVILVLKGQRHEIEGRTVAQVIDTILGYQTPERILAVLS